MKKGVIAPAYLFLGAEAYGRDRCRQALVDAMLAAEEREAGLAQYDLRESALADVVEDARSLSLFAGKRVILVANAEMALPKQKAGDEDEEDAEAPASSGATTGSGSHGPAERSRRARALPSASSASRLTVVVSQAPRSLTVSRPSARCSRSHASCTQSSASASDPVLA